MHITNDIIYVGVNDHKIDLFEGQYIVPKGMSYNSYAIIDDKIAIMDTVDKNFTHEWLDNISAALKGRKPDYLVVQHMEPDHSANIVNFLSTYPGAIVVSSAKAFQMMKNFFGSEFDNRRIVVGEGSTLSLGKHVLTFVTAPMVHWPEVIVTYDSLDKVLFSADGFGKFGALDAKEDWADEARRYYIGIVGKYGMQVQNLLKKASSLEIEIICPLHGPVLSSNLNYYLDLYNTWSSYAVEKEGIMIAYTSVYGHTKKAVELLASKLKAKGCPKVVVYDLARSDMAKATADAFSYGKIVFATTTYNAEIFPFMREFIQHLVERGFKNRTVGFIENGSWAPLATKTMKAMRENCKNLTYLSSTVKIMSALNDESSTQVEEMAEELCREYLAQGENTANKNDMSALFKIGYG
ncbi:MAG: FprA family A-type flavoprotein, partial [Clostridia bacterium]|nr:FprA family A-type flavoprotein [Clostridia bacterium]